MTKEWAGRPVFAVSELVRLLSSELEAAFPDVWVEGEVTGFKRAASGHCYFNLKDDRASLKVVLFRTHALRLGFEPENGRIVLARGRLSVYEAAGDLQLYATVLEPAGLGALQMALEQAKKRLMEEGLTDPARKRPIPPFPRRVAVVTSLEGAALRDVLSVLRRRRATFRVLVVPALVQGALAPASLSAALHRAERAADVDAVLLTRGGGSMEDLWAFNDEALARAVAACPVPVVSAVGHEVDTVLTDLTADLRAPTPSVAAELLTATTREARMKAEEAGRRLARQIQSRLFLAKERLDRARPERLGGLAGRRIQGIQEGADRAADAAGRAMASRLQDDVQRLAYCQRALTPDAVRRWVKGLSERAAAAQTRLAAAGKAPLLRAEDNFAGFVRLLHSLSPLGVLARGYTATFAAGGRPVTSASQAPPGAELSLAFSDGGVDCVVTAAPASHLPSALRPVDGKTPGAVQSGVEEAGRG